MEKRFNASIGSLHEVLKFIEIQLDEHNCSMRTSMMIQVIVEEIFVNIAKYAYPEQDGCCDISIDFNDNYVCISFVDEGIEFNPLVKEDPDIESNADDRPVGGLGIFMMKKTMDEVHYERKDDKNILIIKKNIG